MLLKDTSKIILNNSRHYYRGMVYFTDKQEDKLNASDDSYTEDQ